MKNGATYFKPDSRGSKYPPVATNKNYCLTPFCRNVTDRKKYHSPYCSRCRTARWREKFPLHYSFKNLRTRAKQRGKDFTLTRQQYIDFAIKTDYASMKGRTSLSLTIDRKENALGYHDWNISACTKSSNSRKSFVPFFNGGQMPERDRNEYLELERKYEEPLKRIANEIGGRVGFGTVQFWKEFNSKKSEMYKEAEPIC